MTDSPDPAESVRVISLAGVPGSGKSTLLSRLDGTKVNLVCCTPEKNLGGITWAAKYADFVESQTAAVRCFVGFKNTCVREARATGKHTVVFDRGFEDIACFTEYVGAQSLRARDARRLSAELKCGPYSDLVVYLDVDPTVARARVRRRAKTTEGRGLANPAEYWTYYREWFFRLPHTVVMDNSGEGIADAVRRLVEAIGPPRRVIR